MKGYTKLHAKIIHSSIWREEPHVKILWVTMLAMADSNGVVEASRGGLAHAAGISKEQCCAALELLLAPDDDSSDGTTGERIQAVEGGWLILNHASYRDHQTPQQAATAERVRKHRAKKKAEKDSLPVTPVTQGNAKERAPVSVSVSASASASEKVARPSDVDEKLWKEWVAFRRSRKAPVTQRVITMIRNEATKAKMLLAEAMAEQMSRGWTGFKADWVANRSKTSSNTWMKRIQDSADRWKDGGWDHNPKNTDF